MIVPSLMIWFYFMIKIYLYLLGFIAHRYFVFFYVTYQFLLILHQTKNLVILKKLHF